MKTEDAASLLVEKEEYDEMYEEYVGSLIDEADELQNSSSDPTHKNGGDKHGNRT